MTISSTTSKTKERPKFSWNLTVPAGDPENPFLAALSEDEIKSFNAFQILTIKHIDFRLKQARELFAKVADRHYQAMPFKRQFDAPAVWAGMCSGNYTPEWCDALDASGLGYLGRAEIDCIVDEGGPEAAERLCVAIFGTVNADIARQLKSIANHAPATDTAQAA